jgi:membrane protein
MTDRDRDVLTLDQQAEADNGSTGGDERGRAASSPSDIPAKGWKDVVLRVKDEVKDDHTVLSAAGVAFFGFLALIPALAALVSILGLITSPNEAAARTDDLFGGLPQEARDLLSEQLDSLAQQSSSSLTIALVSSVALALWSASSGMSHLIEGINVAYDEDDDRNFLVKKGLSLALTIGAIVFVVAAAIGLAALPSVLDSLGTPDWLSWIIRVAFWPFLALGFTAGLSILYRTAPDRSDPRWQWVTWGSAIALVLWIAASIGLRIYTSTFGSYNESYGSLAAVVILLMWLFITSFVILLGAQFNAELEHQTAVDTTEGGDQPIGSRNAVAADTVPADDDSDRR